MITWEEKQEMIRLRKLDPVLWSTPKLGELFNLDHTTVIYHLQHPNLVPKERNKPGMGPGIHIKKINKYDCQVCGGPKLSMTGTRCKACSRKSTHPPKTQKSYKDYVAEAKEREEKRLKTL